METLPQTFMEDPVFRHLNRVARYGALSDRDKESYKASLKAYRDTYAIVETERAEGKAEGRAEGLAEGMEKGLAEGRAEGIESEKIETARRMLAKGLDIEMISSCTGLSVEVISKLQK